jgi:hypothetical protein
MLDPGPILRYTWGTDRRVEAFASGGIEPTLPEIGDTHDHGDAGSVSPAILA